MLKRAAGKPERVIDLTEIGRKHNCCWFRSYKKKEKKNKNGKLTFLGFIPFFFSPLNFSGPIMVSLYMPLSDVKQNSKSVVSGLPTADTTVIIFTTTSPHHCRVAAAADTPTRATTFPSSAKFTLRKQRLHLGPSPGPCRGRAVLLLSPSGQRGDGLINMEREGGREGEWEGGGRRDGKHMWETTQKMALCPGRRKAAAETCSSQSSEKKKNNIMKCKSSVRPSSHLSKKNKTSVLFGSHALCFLCFFLHFNKGAGVDHSRQQARLSPEAHLSP